jgi:hypothetical protein
MVMPAVVASLVRRREVIGVVAPSVLVDVVDENTIHRDSLLSAEEALIRAKAMRREEDMSVHSAGHQGSFAVTSDA